MSNETLDEVMARIQQEAETAEGAPVFVRTCGPGDEIRQGDIYLYPLDGRPSAGLQPLPSLQLAEGTSAGSRHVLEGEAIAYDRPPPRGPLDGPYVHARERVVLTHPEHAHISLPAGWYEVRYQRDWSVPARSELSQVIRRVAD